MTWQEKLAGRIPPALAEEIHIFETEMERRARGELEEKVFAETRLRRGVYGQRYDNGQRHDGTASRTIAYPSGDRTKGPNTLWDAPGMQRIRIPYGKLSAEQMDVMADLAEEISTGILHVTTRQDIQIHYLHIEDTPDMMRRLGAVGITTREACGNVVRNLTACPLSGICRTEAFDTTPYADALASFLLGHPDTQDFGRKFKIAFSGCGDEPCGLTGMHDLGFIARTRQVDGRTVRGFEVQVGGGLGAVPHQAKPFDPFLPESEVLPLAQAIGRVFARLGEKKNRARARIKFLVADQGIEEFQRLIREERAVLPEDPRWTEFLDRLHATDENPLRPPAPATAFPLGSEGFHAWRTTNVSRQRQEGYAAVAITLPLGDLTSVQMRGLADLARRVTGDTVRLTVDQNILFRWVPEAELPAFHRELEALGLAAPGAGTLVDVTSCPGTDTCKLGISSSRGLAGELRTRLTRRNAAFDDAVKDLKIKISGCFNSCGQHHVADIGFYGVSRKAGGRTVPHFQVVLGGQARENAGAFGLAIGAVPSRRIPDALLSITDLYRAERESGESFRRFVERVGKGRIKTLLQDLTRVPAYEVDRSLYSDWGDPREYTTGDMGKGECAGEVVSQLDFGLAAAERMSFEAQLQLDAGNPAEAIDLAYRSMLKAAWALVRDEFLDVGEEPERIVEEFRARFFDTGRFHDPFAGSKFASYFFAAHAARSGADGNARPADARQRLEEAQLFIEAAYACQGRLAEANAPGAGNGSGNGAGNGRGNGAGPAPTNGTGGGNGRSAP